MPPSKQLVLGLGNSLAGDDGFGPAVVERLIAGGGLAAVDVENADTDLLGRIDTLAAYDHVILVDAVLGLSEERHVTVIAEDDLAAWPHSSSGCHHLSPLLALRLFRQLYPGARTRVTLVALGTGRISPHDTLPPAIVEAGVHAVRRLLASSSQEAGSS